MFRDESHAVEKCEICEKKIPHDKMRKHYDAEHKRTDVPCRNCNHAIGNHVTKESGVSLGCRECRHLEIDPICDWVFDEAEWTTKPSKPAVLVA